MHMHFWKLLRLRMLKAKSMKMLILVGNVAVLGNVPKDVQRPNSRAWHIKQTLRVSLTIEEHPDLWDEEFALLWNNINM